MPHQLYKRITDVVKWRKIENFERNSDRFIREVAKQSEKLQTERRAAPAYLSGKIADVQRRQEADFLRGNRITHESAKLKPAEY